MGLLDYLKSRSKRGGPVGNFGTVLDGRIYRGGLPSQRGYERLAALGVATVVNLIEGFAVEEREKILGSGVRHWIHLPMSDRVLPSGDLIGRWLRTTGVEELWPIFVHCKGGRHRTGGMVAVYRIRIQGWSPQSAYREAVEYGYYDAFGHERWGHWIKAGCPRVI